MFLVDTHCHLYAPEFDADRLEAITRAEAKSLKQILLPNIDVASIEPLKQVSAQFQELCRPMMGLHPCYVNKNVDADLRTIKEELYSNSYIAVGEIGLDFYWDLTFKDQQIKAFREQLRWAKELKLPVAIHTRNSFAEALQIVQEENSDDLTGVFHCFGGTLEDAQSVIDLGGFYMGIGGVLTFKNAGLDKIVKDIPFEYIVLETDAPYLAPVPNRGKRNEPAFLYEIALKLAEIKETTLDEVALHTTRNADKLFRLNLDRYE